MSVANWRIDVQSIVPASKQTHLDLLVIGLFLSLDLVVGFSMRDRFVSSEQQSGGRLSIIYFL